MTSLPLWLQIVGLIAGLLWPTYQLVRAIMGPKLEARLTQDLFFRLLDMGECMFLRPVLIAEHGNVLITKVQANLKKTDSGASKSWQLEFLKFGEVDSKNVEASFRFHSSSPLRFLSKGLPVQAVYLARVKGYGSEYAKIVKEFSEQLLPIKERAIQLTSNADESKQTEIGEEVRDLSKQYADKIFDKIQLEAGRYEIDLELTYRGVSGLGAYINRQTKTSKLSFEIETNAREQIKSELPPTFLTIGLNNVFNLTNPIVFPEYAPINKREDAIV